MDLELSEEQRALAHTARSSQIIVPMKAIAKAGELD